MTAREISARTIVIKQKRTLKKIENKPKETVKKKNNVKCPTSLPRRVSRETWLLNSPNVTDHPTTRNSRHYDKRDIHERERWTYWSNLFNMVTHGTTTWLLHLLSSLLFLLYVEDSPISGESRADKKRSIAHPPSH